MSRLFILGALLSSLSWAQEEAPAPVEPEMTVEEALAPLEAAYQKEYAYLSAEKRELEARLAAQQTEADRVSAEAESSIRQLEARLTALQVQVENAEVLLEDVERKALSAAEADDALDAAWFQAKNTLEDGSYTLPEPTGEDLGARAEGFLVAWGEAASRVEQGGQVRKEAGQFFDQAGNAVKGDLVKVGEVATFGVSGDTAYALVPVGEDRLQAWRQGGGATGLALSSGSASPSMGLYLHEGRTKRIDEAPPKTLQDVLDAGGVVGWVILALGALALLMMLARVMVLRSAEAGQKAVAKALKQVGDGSASLKTVESLQVTGGVSAMVLARLLPNLHRDRDSLEDLAQEALLEQTPRVERFGAAILVVAAVAPLLGLLGTVTGMIATFDIITEFGTGDPRMLSGGISSALVTTQFGLIVAIPALLGGNLLSGWAETVLSRAEGVALSVVNEGRGVPQSYDSARDVRRM